LEQVEQLWAEAQCGGTSVLSGQPNTSGGWDAHLWYSDDGLIWQAATMPDEPQIDRIHAIAASSAGCVALGLDFSGEETLTQVLVSSDGREWRVAGSFVGLGTILAEINGRLLAFGNNSWKSDPWYSDDGGRAWQKLDSESGLAVANGLLDLELIDDFLYAVRSDDPVDDASIKTPIELWRTDNGLDWSKVTDLPGSIAAGKATLASGPLGWVIAARRTTFDDMEQINEWFAWWSGDGVVWQPAKSAPRYIGQMVGDQLGFIAIGRDPGPCCALEESNVRANIWTSADGLSWHQQPQQGWHGREIDAITSVGDEIVGVGIDWKFWPGRSSIGWGVTWTVDRAALLP
jgi:hypothetical protein